MFNVWIGDMNSIAATGMLQAHSHAASAKCEKRSAGLSAKCELGHATTLQSRRMSGLTGRTAASPRMVGGPLPTDSVEKQRVAGAESSPLNGARVPL